MAASTSEDNVVMVWQPTMRVWAGDEVRIDERELEGDAMEGIEETMEVEPQAEAEAEKRAESAGNGSGETEDGQAKSPGVSERRMAEGSKDVMAVEVEMDIEKQEKAQEQPKEEDKEDGKEKTSEAGREEQEKTNEGQEKRKSEISSGSGTQSMDVSAEPSVVGGDD
jgi:hypothetical protein